MPGTTILMKKNLNNNLSSQKFSSKAPTDSFYPRPHGPKAITAAATLSAVSRSQQTKLLACVVFLVNVKNLASWVICLQKKFPLG